MLPTPNILITSWATEQPRPPGDNCGDGLEILIFLSFLYQNYLVGTHWNCLIEEIPISTHMIYNK